MHCHRNSNLSGEIDLAEPRLGADGSSVNFSRHMNFPTLEFACAEESTCFFHAPHEAVEIWLFHFTFLSCPMNKIDLKGSVLIELKGSVTIECEFG
jgi:hypothetical protein